MVSNCIETFLDGVYIANGPLTTLAGDFFIHFLDAPEQGLLVIPLFTDIYPNGGGTWICSEGPRRIGKWLVSARSRIVVFLLLFSNGYQIVRKLMSSLSGNSTTILRVSHPI